MIPASIQKIMFDTHVWLYFLQDTPPYAIFIQNLLKDCMNGKHQLYIPLTTQLEVLANPALSSQQSQQYLQLFNHHAFTTLETSKKEIARITELQKRYQLHLLEAIKISSALTTGIDLFITNNNKLQKIVECHIKTLDELTNPSV